MVDETRPSTWIRFKPGLCTGCRAGCCALPVEAGVEDLVRLGWIHEDETAGSLKKVARRLIAERKVRSFRARTGLFTLEQKLNGDCLLLGIDRRCTVYERRPEVCRSFPAVGPRSGFCPKQDSGGLLDRRLTK